MLVDSEFALNHGLMGKIRVKVDGVEIDEAISADTGTGEVVRYRLPLETDAEGSGVITESIYGLVTVEIK